MKEKKSASSAQNTKKERFQENFLKAFFLYFFSNAWKFNYIYCLLNWYVVDRGNDTIAV